MIVVLPVCAKDEALAVKNLEWCIELEKSTPFDCLITHDHTFDPGKVSGLATRYFRTVYTFKYDAWGGVNDWPAPQNWAWQRTAEFINGWAHRDSWFWWEADATPLQKGWVHMIADAHVSGGRPFSGRIVREGPTTGHMTGVGVYPPDTPLHSTNAMLVRQHPFDVVLRQDVVPNKVHDIPHVIQHLWDIGGQPPSFVTIDEVNLTVDRKCAIFHRCKDGSLIDCLASRPPKKIKGFSGQNSFQSFTQQTDWPAGFFYFPHSPNVLHFNPALVHHAGTDYLITRRFTMNNPPFGSSDLAMWRLGKNMMPMSPQYPTLPKSMPGEQWEDPRAVSYGGHIYLSCVTWVHHKPYLPHQVFAVLNANNVAVVAHPQYRGNAGNIAGNKKPQKNWTWFVHDGAWHFVYQIAPHTVVRYEPNNQLTEYIPDPAAKIHWPYGEPRGGTPPVLVGDEYWSFFHSSLGWKGKLRRYFMGAYAFSAKAPFRVTRFSVRPILVGSEYDDRSPWGFPLVVWAAGCIFRDGVWTIALGINDVTSGWIKIPHADLEPLMDSTL